MVQSKLWPWANPSSLCQPNITSASVGMLTSTLEPVLGLTLAAALAQGSWLKATHTLLVLDGGRVARWEKLD